MPTFETPDGRLEVVLVEPEAKASPSSPTVIFLHEGLGSVTGWRGLPQRITQACRLPSVVYSRLGYGKSDALTEQEFGPGFLDDEATTTLPALIEHLSLETTVLVGHSDGASIALRYALDRPASLLGLVLIAPHTFVEDVTLDGIRAATKRFSDTPSTTPNRLRTALARQHGDKTEQTFRAWSNVWLSESFRGWDLRPWLHRLACPTLLIQGTLDQYGTHEQIDSVSENAAGPTEVFWLAGGGHAPHLERPDETADRIVQFIGKLVAWDF